MAVSNRIRTRTKREIRVRVSAGRGLIASADRGRFFAGFGLIGPNVNGRAGPGDRSRRTE